LQCMQLPRFLVHLLMLSPLTRSTTDTAADSVDRLDTSLLLDWEYVIIVVVFLECGRKHEYSEKQVKVVQMLELVSDLPCLISCQLSGT